MTTPNPLNVKILYGTKYRIGMDPAALKGNDDPWLFLILCKHGNIYPHSDRLLAVYCNAPILSHRLGEIKGIIPHQIGDSEAVYNFPPALFDQVAKIVKPRTKRTMPENTRLALADHWESLRKPITRAKNGTIKPKTRHGTW